MTNYERTYTPPVFHIADADEEQKALMGTVFDTLLKSDIEFVIVDRNEKDGVLNVICNGIFNQEERAEILAEIQEIYDTE